VIRAVLDPGVLIAALLSARGAPAGLLLAWMAGRFDLVVSPVLLGELERVLLRPKFRRYATQQQVHEYVARFRRDAILVPDPVEVEIGLTPDPGDDYLVALARSAGAHYLVSGDAHLTNLVASRPPVLTPRAFLDILGLT
jgi:putative PIN family toxin of toxin-antitoxin system